MADVENNTKKNDEKLNINTREQANTGNNPNINVIRSMNNANVDRAANNSNEFNNQDNSSFANVNKNTSPNIMRINMTNRNLSP